MDNTFFIKLINEHYKAGEDTEFFLDNEWKIIYLVKGVARFSTIETQMPLYEREGVFVNLRILHKLSFSEDSEVFILSFNPDSALREDKYIYDKYILPLIHSSIPFVSLSKTKTQGLSWAYSNYSEDINPYELSITSALYETLFSILKEHSEKLNRVVSKQNEKLIKLLEYIHNNYMYPISLADLAKQINTSTREVVRIFNKHIDSTPLQYINNYRLQRAKVMLKDTNLTVTEIATKVGYESSSHFTKSFKDKFLITPSSFKK